MSTQKQALESLLAFEQPLKPLISALGAFPWDSDAELALLSVDHITSLLHRFATGRTTGIELEAWANAVEGRDDIGFEPPNHDLLRDLLHELANPRLTRALTRERAVELLKNIESTPGPRAAEEG